MANEKQAGILDQIRAGTKGFTSGWANTRRGAQTLSHAEKIRATGHYIPIPSAAERVAPGAMDSAADAFHHARAADASVKQLRDLQKSEQQLLASGGSLPHGAPSYSNISEAQWLHGHGLHVPEHYQEAPSVPQAEPGFFQRHGNTMALLGGGSLLGYAALKGGTSSQEVDNRMQDYMRNSQSDLDTPMPPLSVYPPGHLVFGSYDAFAQEKLASPAAAPLLNPYPTAQAALANALAQQLANKFIGEPMDAVQKVLRKRLYEDPKHLAAYNNALAADEMLQQHDKENPDSLPEAYKTLKTFAPSLSKDPHVTRSWLRQSVMSGMHGTGPDFATIRLLAETEKNIQNAGK